jgi:hypothetical protein
MLNIEILDCFSHYTLVIQKTIVVLHLFFYLKYANKWNFCEDVLLKSCFIVQAMYQDYVPTKIWISKLYMIFST